MFVGSSRFCQITDEPQRAPAPPTDEALNICVISQDCMLRLHYAEAMPVGLIESD